MPIKENNTPYDSVITIDTKCGGYLQLDVTRKGEINILNVSHSSCKYSVVDVSSEVFVQFVDNSWESYLHRTESLGEEMLLSDKGMYVNVKLTWDDEHSISCEVLKRDILSLAERFNNQKKVATHFNKSYNKPSVKIRRCLKKMFNLPRKVLRW